MRIGFNPNKQNNLIDEVYTHQVIIPLHIPEEKGYHSESFSIFKICIESLIKTSHNKTFITVVCNDCAENIIEFVNNLFKQKKIHEVIYTNGIGKINSILKGLSGQNMSLVTISDADVLFLNGWQEATYDVFNAFPKAGAVSTSPSSKVLKQFTANVLVDNFFSKKMKMHKVKDPLAMIKFSESIGNKNFYNKFHLEKYMLISNNGINAVVGAGHYVVTYNRNIFKRPISNFTKFKMGNALKQFFDEPVMLKGYYRLSTESNYTYHMGNSFESWMQEIFVSLKGSNNSKNDIKIVDLKEKRISKIIYKFLFKILTRKPFWELFLRYKGLSSFEAKEY